MTLGIPYYWSEELQISGILTWQMSLNKDKEKKTKSD